jgi:hypothetical protein
MVGSKRKTKRVGDLGNWKKAIDVMTLGQLKDKQALLDARRNDLKKGVTKKGKDKSITSSVKQLQSKYGRVKTKAAQKLNPNGETPQDKEMEDVDADIGKEADSIRNSMSLENDGFGDQDGYISGDAVTLEKGRTPLNDELYDDQRKPVAEDRVARENVSEVLGGGVREHTDANTQTESTNTCEERQEGADSPIVWHCHVLKLPDGSSMDVKYKDGTESKLSELERLLAVSNRVPASNPQRGDIGLLQDVHRGEIIHEEVNCDFKSELSLCWPRAADYTVHNSGYTVHPRSIDGALCFVRTKEKDSVGKVNKEFPELRDFTERRAAPYGYTAERLTSITIPVVIQTTPSDEECTSRQSMVRTVNKRKGSPSVGAGKKKK